MSDTRFLNFYEFEAVHRDGTSAPYFVASRAKKIEQLKVVSHENKPDGVVLSAFTGRKRTGSSSSASTVTRWGLRLRTPPVL